MFAGIRRRVARGGRSLGASAPAAQASGGCATPARRGSSAPAGGIQSVRFESPTAPVPAPSPEEIDLGELDSGDLRHLLVRGPEAPPRQGA
eukprot:8228068-Pyramimonas_sp.AAC.1